MAECAYVITCTAREGSQPIPDGQSVLYRMGYCSHPRLAVKMAQSLHREHGWKTTLTVDRVFVREWPTKKPGWLQYRSAARAVRAITRNPV